MPRVEQFDRDYGYVERMLRYCEQIDEALAEIGHSKERFLSSHVYQNAVSMCILQLGELAKCVSNEFRAAHPEMPWSYMAKTRDHYAHHYGYADFEIIWSTAVNDIPSVKTICQNILQ